MWTPRVMQFHAVGKCMIADYLVAYAWSTFPVIYLLGSKTINRLVKPLSPSPLWGHSLATPPFPSSWRPATETKREDTPTLALALPTPCSCCLNSCDSFALMSCWAVQSERVCVVVCDLTFDLWPSVNPSFHVHLSLVITIITAPLLKWQWIWVALPNVGTLSPHPLTQLLPSQLSVKWSCDFLTDSVS